MTPNLPEATCFIADLLELPSSRGLNLIGSSPPSPVLDFPPNLFMARANDSWASVDIDPRDIAPVANLFTISFSGSTLSKGIGFFENLNFIKPLKVLFFVVSSLAWFEKFQYADSSLFLAAIWRAEMDFGSHMWESPPFLQWKSPGFGNEVTLFSRFSGKPIRWRLSISSDKISKVTPWTLLGVPGKDFSMISSESPTASKICAPL